ncbi:hypothetical protein [Antarcticirhabdus aurantiaca]|uniref:Uncharacterized protein n=1 Tax=Antarcticirhabdus aurantiaca TaxID=2606717 RepID=A0ACD4NWK7_9HYPH|nr:hypothetical protein [Antarcticirhabdus aurantiaca]WAJ31191.1 hypothetical protein OXU80_13730 [Jeongeuplla avenae]
MVTGESRPGSDANFDEELGRKIARDAGGSGFGAGGASNPGV